MREICSYGSVGVSASNRRHYPETRKHQQTFKLQNPKHNLRPNTDVFGTQEIRKMPFEVPEFLSSKFKMSH